VLEDDADATELLVLEDDVDVLEDDADATELLVLEDDVDVLEGDVDELEAELLEGDVDEHASSHDAKTNDARPATTRATNEASALTGAPPAKPPGGLQSSWP
jgi:hypothetical protein